MGVFDWLLPNPFNVNSAHQSANNVNKDVKNYFSDLGNGLSAIAGNNLRGNPLLTDASTRLTSSGPGLLGGLLNKWTNPLQQLAGRGQQGTSTADILARLQELQDSSRYYDPYGLDEEARSAANAQYDPIISGLRSQMSAAQTRGDRNKQELGNMFNSLSSGLAAQLPQIEQRFTAGKQDTASQYGALKDKIANTYAETQASQEALYKRLGIEAAADDVLPNQARDQAYFTSVADTQNQTAQTALSQEQTGATEFTRKSSDIARAEGVNQQSNLMANLEELLSSLQGQISANEAAKTQSYTSNLGSLRRESMDSAQKNSQRDVDNYLQMIRLGRELSPSSTAGTKAVASPADVGARAINLGLPQRSAQNIQSVFMSALGNDSTILAGIDPTFGQSLSKEALASRVVEAGRAQNLSQQELNILQTLALEYFGRS